VTLLPLPFRGSIIATSPTGSLFISQSYLWSGTGLRPKHQSRPVPTYQHRLLVWARLNTLPLPTPPMQVSSLMRVSLCSYLESLHCLAVSNTTVSMIDGSSLHPILGHANKRQEVVIEASTKHRQSATSCTAIGSTKATNSCGSVPIKFESESDSTASSTKVPMCSTRVPSPSRGPLYRRPPASDRR
jgi:hypothetical protein